MKTQFVNMRNRTETFDTRLQQEHRLTGEMLSHLAASIKTLQGETADRRLHQLSRQVKQLQERLEQFYEMAGRDFVSTMREAAEKLAQQERETSLGRVVAPLLKIFPAGLNELCEKALDSLIEVTQAERGFILFYHPDSTEAEVLAARNFQTTNLSLDEYNFSRTLLREVCRTAAPLRLDDAAQHPDYSAEISVVNLQLKSVLAVPLKKDGRAIGSIYLENHLQPCAFDKSDLQLVEAVGEFLLFYLQQSRLLPLFVETEGRVFLDARKAYKEIVGQDPQIQKLLEVVGRIADSPATVLIEGESGAGKELVARALHYESARRDRPFVAINCAAIPDNLLESELFGHEKGAFTGATEQYIGRIEQAHGGTLFLDEVSELAYPLEAKLLRFLQSNEFNRLGGKQTIRVDVRTVAATSKDLKLLVESGKFYDALYYRLHVIPVHVPPLRDHRGDVPLLWDHFISKFSVMYGKHVRSDPEVREWLSHYDFPGNVRELENLAHRLVALSSGDVIRLGDLPPELLKVSSKRVSLIKDPSATWGSRPPSNLDELRLWKRQMHRLLQEQEKLLLEQTIRECRGNLTQASRRLGIHRVTLHKMIRRGKTKTRES